MKEFEALLESELLSSDVKEELTQAITEAKQAIYEQARKDLEVDFAKRFQNEKQELTEGLYKMINEAVDSEIAELKEDIEHYRGLEITYAQKLEEFKTEYAQKLNEGFHEFVAKSVAGEVQELREDIEHAKKLNFGMKLFEAFASEFEEFGVGDDVKSLRQKLSDVRNELKEAREESAKLNRSIMLEGLLSNLSGSKRKVMETILENVATDKLEARYEEALPSILREDKEEKTDETKSTTVITESKAKLDDEIIRVRKLAGLK